MILAGCTILAAAGPSRPAAAVDFDVSASLLTRGGYRGNALRDELLLDAARVPLPAGEDVVRAFAVRDYLALEDDGAFWLVWASVQAALGMTEWLSFHATVDSGAVFYERSPADEPIFEGVDVSLPSDRRPYGWTIQGRDPVEEAQASGFVREVYARLDLAAGAVTVGKRLFHVGEGYVYDDFGVGASAEFEVASVAGLPFLVGGAALLPARDWDSEAWTSPLVTVSLELELSPLESVRLAGVYFLDDMDALGATVQAASVAEAVDRLQAAAAAGDGDPQRLRERARAVLTSGVGGRAHLGWLVAAADVLVGDVLLHARAVGVFGRADLVVAVGSGTTATTFATQADVLGFGGDVSAEWLVSDQLILEPFALVLTGDDRPPLRLGGGSADYHSFVGIVPYWTFSNLFFQGGLNESLSQRGASPAGVAGAGVVAVGLETLVSPHADWMLRGRALYLWALEPPPTRSGGQGYGLELDLELRWQPLEWLGVAGEADALFPGSAFEGDAPFWKVQAGLDVVY